MKIFAQDKRRFLCLKTPSNRGGLFIKKLKGISDLLEKRMD